MASLKAGGLMASREGTSSSAVWNSGSVSLRPMRRASSSNSLWYSSSVSSTSSSDPLSVALSSSEL